MPSLTDNQAALICLVCVALAACFARPEAKDVLLATVGGVVGWMSKGAQ